MSARLEDAVAFYADPAPAALERAPFRFLDAYEREDRAYFFGRDAEIEDLRSRFYRSRVFVVYGESGAGKTSLLQCGLANAIAEEEAEFHFVRSHVDPIAAVRQRLDDERGSPAPAAAALLALPELIAARARATSRTVALVFDQFEELFLFQPVEVRRKLLDELHEAIARRLDVRVVFCLREEYLSRMTEVEEVIPDVFANRFWLRRMRASDARQVIEAPCRRAGIALEAGLATGLIEQLRDPRGEIDLPYLQIVLDRLYRRAIERGGPVELTIKDVEALGSMEEILSSFLEARVRELAFPELGRDLLKLFVTSAHTRKAVDVATLARAMASRPGALRWPPTLGDEAGQAMLATLHALVQIRILRQDHADAPYELRHDTLAEAITRWLTPLEEEQVQLRSLIEHRYAEFVATGALIQDGKLLARLQPHLGKLGLPPEMNDLVRRSLAAVSTTSRRRVRVVVAAAILGALVLGALVYYVVHNALAVQDYRARIALLEAQNLERGLILRVRELEAAGRPDAALALIWSRQQQGDPVTSAMFARYARDHAASRVVIANPAVGWSPLNPDGATVLRRHAGGLERVRVTTGVVDGPALRAPGAAGEVVAAAYSADGAQLAFAEVMPVPRTGLPWRITLVVRWRIGRPEPESVVLMHGDARITAMAFARNGSLLIADDQRTLFDLSEGQDRADALQLDEVITAMTRAPGDDRVALGDRAGGVRIWVPRDARSPVFHGRVGRPLPRSLCPGSPPVGSPGVVAVQWSATGDRLFAVGTGAAPAGWRVADPSPARELDLGCEATGVVATAAALSPDGAWLAVGDARGDVRMLATDGPDLASEAASRSPARASRAAISALAFAADGSLAIGDERGALSIWRSLARTSRQLDGHTGRIASLAFVPGEAGTATLVSAEDAGPIHLWRVAVTEPRRLATLEIAAAESRRVWWAHDGLILMTGGRTLRAWRGAHDVWDAETTPRILDSEIDDVAVAPGLDRSVVVVTRDGRYHLFSTESLLEGPRMSAAELAPTYLPRPQPTRSPDGRLEVRHDGRDRLAIYSVTAAPEPEPSEVGAASNLRPCPGSFDVVAVVPFPPASQLWADPASCGQESR